MEDRMKPAAEGTVSENTVVGAVSADVRFSPDSGPADRCGKPGPCGWCDSLELESRLQRVETGEGVDPAENLEDDALYLAGQARQLMAEVKRCRQLGIDEVDAHERTKAELAKVRDARMIEAGQRALAESERDKLQAEVDDLGCRIAAFITETQQLRDANRRLLERALEAEAGLKRHDPDGHEHADEQIRRD